MGCPFVVLKSGESPRVKWAEGLSEEEIDNGEELVVTTWPQRAQLSRSTPAMWQSA